MMVFKEARDRKKKIKKLEEEISTVERAYSKDLQGTSEDEASYILRMIRHETFDFERQLSFLREQPIRTKAERLGIDIPGEWEEDFLGTDWCRRLSPLGRAKLQDTITRKRRETIKWWVELLAQILGLLIALIASLTALFAVRSGH